MTDTETTIIIYTTALIIGWPFILIILADFASTYAMYCDLVFDKYVNV